MGTAQARAWTCGARSIRGGCESCASGLVHRGVRRPGGFALLLRTGGGGLEISPRVGHAADHWIADGLDSGPSHDSEGPRARVRLLVAAYRDWAPAVSAALRDALRRAGPGPAQRRHHADPAGPGDGPAHRPVGGRTGHRTGPTAPAATGRSTGSCAPGPPRSSVR